MVVLLILVYSYRLLDVKTRILCSLADGSQFYLHPKPELQYIKCGLIHLLTVCLATVVKQLLRQLTHLILCVRNLSIRLRYVGFIFFSRMRVCVCLLLWYTSQTFIWMHFALAICQVSRLMDLIVHSLYSNKEVFLQELIRLVDVLLLLCLSFLLNFCLSVCAALHNHLVYQFVD